MYLKIWLRHWRELIDLMKWEERVLQIIVSIFRGSHIRVYQNVRCARLECLTAVVLDLQQDMCHTRFLMSMLSYDLLFCCFSTIDRRCIEFASNLSFGKVNGETFINLKRGWVAENTVHPIRQRFGRRNNHVQWIWLFILPYKQRLNMLMSPIVLVSDAEMF